MCVGQVIIGERDTHICIIYVCAQRPQIVMCMGQGIIGERDTQTYIIHVYLRDTAPSE